ncbi:MAG: S41 family peptidase [Siphonobacter sp.]
MENHSSKNIRNSLSIVRLPILLAVTLAGGILIGAAFFGGRPRYSGDVVRNLNKFREIMTWIDNAYVDSVNTDTLVDYTLEKMMTHLDPHSVYIPQKEVAESKAALESGFDGIGVEFNTFNDTVFVINVIPGGPSELAGIRSGDRLIRADGMNLTGKKIDNKAIFSKLRGNRGSVVKLEIQRRGEKNLLAFNITRGRIPSFSVSAGYMINEHTGYIKIDRFAESTYTEFKNSLASLKKQGMTQLMLDLRGNGGGFKDRATNIVDELIGGNKLIVRTDGKNPQFDEETYSKRDGLFEKGAVILLVDENSASASEIVAGALQDHDRALIVGRRTFGKGLVQTPVDLTDGSQIRITVSRYYTPSGRCIQKPYSIYDNDSDDRYKHGELFSQDSIKFDKKQAFKTDEGRTVYGGGGIIPDVFVGADTTYRTKYLYQLIGKNIVAEYAFRYALNHKNQLNKDSFEHYLTGFKVTDSMLADITAMASASGIARNESQWNRSKEYVRNQTKALIASYVWETRSSMAGLRNELYETLNSTDLTYQKALSYFPQADQMARRQQ